MKRQVPRALERNTRAMFTKILLSFARQLSDDEMSVAQAAALHVIDQATTMRSSALGAELAATPSTVSRLVDALVQKGFVDRAEDPSDRRAKLLRLTERGEAFVRGASEKRVTLILDTLEKHVPKPLLAAMLRTMGAIERL